jgi:hypothetical protein
MIAQIAEALAFALMDRVDREPLRVADGVTVVDVAIEEGDRCFGILLSDGRTFEVTVAQTAPVPKR